MCPVQHESRSDKCGKTKEEDVLAETLERAQFPGNGECGHRNEAGDKQNGCDGADAERGSLVSGRN